MNLVAVDIIKIALQSGKIKLKGNTEPKVSPASVASADAAYLIALFHGLVAGLPKS